MPAPKTPDFPIFSSSKAIFERASAVRFAAPPLMECASLLTTSESPLKIPYPPSNSSTAFSKFIGALD